MRASFSSTGKGVVCNVGSAHLEFFGDVAGVAKEKGTLFTHVKPAGAAIYPADTPHAAALRTLAGTRVTMTFGAAPDADIRIEYLGRQGERFGVVCTWPAAGKHYCLNWTLGGQHQACNAGAAAAVGTVLGLTPEEILRGLQTCELPSMRMEVRVHAGVHWVNDAYNANPESMRASIRWFKELTASVAPDQRVAVLGDMLELGSHAVQAHADLVEFARQELAGTPILTVGPSLAAPAQRCGLRHFADSAAVRDYLQAHLKPGQWVLLKASHGIHLEKVLPGA